MLAVFASDGCDECGMRGIGAKLLALYCATFPRFRWMVCFLRFYVGGGQ